MAKFQLDAKQVNTVRTGPDADTVRSISTTDVTLDVTTRGNEDPFFVYRVSNFGTDDEDFAATSTNVSKLVSTGQPKVRLDANRIEFEVLQVTTSQFSGVYAFFTRDQGVRETLFVIRLAGDEFPDFNSASDFNSQLAEAQITVPSGAFAPGAEITLDVDSAGGGANSVNLGDGGARFNGRGRTDDDVAGGDGNDKIKGGGGDDTVDGGAGKDKISGGGGADSLSGGADNDKIQGGGGDDTIDGGDGNDNLVGGGGADSILGGDGNDKIKGGGGGDVIDGGAGNDKIVAGGGADDISGGEGDDNINAGGGDDTVNGGQGDDVIKAAGGADVLIFQTGDGNDSVKGFQDGSDLISILAGAASFAEVTVDADGDDALIAFSDVTIRLENTDSALIEETDFLFGA